jgi:hypothetical protein
VTTWEYVLAEFSLSEGKVSGLASVMVLAAATFATSLDFAVTLTLKSAWALLAASETCLLLLVSGSAAMTSSGS